MSYLNEGKSAAVFPLGAIAVDVLTATGVHSYSYVVQKKIAVSRIMATITTLTAIDTVNARIAFKRYPTHGSATGEEVIGNLYSQDALAVGKVLYKDVEPVLCYPGDQIVFEVVTAGTDSGAAAGGAVYGFEFHEVPEQADNSADMVETAAS